MNEMDIDFCMLLFSCSQHAQLHTSITSTYIKNIFLMLHLLFILFTRPFSIALQGVCSTGYIITAAGLVMAVAFRGLFSSSELILNQVLMILVR